MLPHRFLTIIVNFLNFSTISFSLPATLPKWLQFWVVHTCYWRKNTLSDTQSDSSNTQSAKISTNLHVNNNFLPSTLLWFRMWILNKPLMCVFYFFFLSAKHSLSKMGGAVTTEVGGICLKWALCLLFVLTTPICPFIWKQHLNLRPNVVAVEKYGITWNLAGILNGLIWNVSQIIL